MDWPPEARTFEAVFKAQVTGKNGVPMGSRGTEIDGQQTADSTPEDVAALYSWANLQGAKYRDYSASRREYRAQVRYRAAKALLERELQAQAEAEAAAKTAEQGALAAESTVQPHVTTNGKGTLSREGADAAARRGVAERVEAARRAEAAAHAAVLALREEREIAEARNSAKRQAMMYEESELRRRRLAGPQPHGLPGNPSAGSGEVPGDSGNGGVGSAQQSTLQGWQVTSERQIPVDQELRGLSAMELPQTLSSDAAAEAQQAGPAWLFSAPLPARARVLQAISHANLQGNRENARGETPERDTLQDSRERVASRWFALKGVFEDSKPELPAMQPLRPGAARAPLVAVFSLAGGVGKTSLVATLGRALSSQGEKVLVADTTAHGLLPIYFGAREVRPGMVCVFSTPPGSTDQAISLVIRDGSGRDADDRKQEMLADEILRDAQDSNRIVLDLAAGSCWLVRRLADLHPTVLVPMAPDMNSVISLQAVERTFKGITGLEGRPLLPFYVLNQFDATLPLHLDVREVFRRQLGERLVRVAIRRAPVVSEALAEGMTVLDYAPDAPVTQDYQDVARWLREVSPPMAEFHRVRWGER